ncbi:choice-of-anchor G family protein [Raineyella sp. LH-20]|uniref:choice-of-anchor G family protein n=1 Tax=Raineyella sp. LH-20 TaxID=3081204 RepID=UPI002952E835|nr:choice-of-anchor G family protein [Raineyella sp. LH-20]WOP20089.1 choice-of-anchor G family protein [Raineyella sp. LH-20]
MAVKAVPAWAASPTPCTDWTYTQVRAASQFLSGTLLGTRLSQVFLDPAWTDFQLADLRGLQVTTNPPAAPVVDPAAGSERLDAVANAPAYRMKLDLQALQLLEVIAGIKLGSLIKTPVGAVNQFAQATYNGTANGSTGAVDNSSGVIDLSNSAGSTTWASINLRNLLNEALGGSLSGLGDVVADNLLDLSLDVGAVAGRAWQDTCTNCVNRDYLLAWLKLVVTSPLLAAIYDALVPVLGGLQTTVNGLIGTNSVVSGLLNQIENAVNALPLGLGANADLSVELDASALLAALGSDLFPSSDLLDVGLGAGKTLGIDLGVLLGGAYQADGTNTALNGLAPNTGLLVNASAVTNLVDELGKIGQDIVGAIVGLIKVNLNIQVSGLGGDLATIKLQAGENNTDPVTIGGLLNGQFYLKVSLLSGVPIVGDLLSALTSLVTTTVSGLVGQLGGALKTLVGDAVLTTTVNAAISQLVAFVNQLLTKLFVVPGILSLTANAQNDPTVGCNVRAGGGAEPSDWAGIQEGEYDVAALRLSVLQAVDTRLVTLYLARGAVGPVAASAGTAPVAPAKP